MNVFTVRGTLDAMADDWKMMFAKRLDAFLDEHPESASQVARGLGRSRAWLSNWRSGQNIPPADEFAAFCKATRAPAAYLLGLADSPEPEPPSPPVDQSDYITVPLLRDRAAAGQPLAVDGSDVIVRLPFTKHWVKNRIGTLPREGRLVLIRVHKGWLGESMLPTITQGSTLLIDRGPSGEGLTSVEDGRVYLISWDDGLTVKRVHRAGEHLVCSPDNVTGKHRPFVVALKGRRLQEVVKGKVIWVANQDV